MSISINFLLLDNCSVHAIHPFLGVQFQMLILMKVLIMLNVSISIMFKQYSITVLASCLAAKH